MARIGLIIIGDEILSGRRSDQHLPRVIRLLGERGLVLNWVRIVGDDHQLLDETFRQSFATGDIVFCTGGIGATPDDMTREAVARTIGVKTERHPEGVMILEKLARDRNLTLSEQLYRLIEFPAGSKLIPNAVNSLPGFSVGDHHFVPGFPEMAWPMIDWVLDNRYQHLRNENYREMALLIKGRYESDMIPIMEEMEKNYPDVKMFCLPSMKYDIPVNEIGLKGRADRVNMAFEEVVSILDRNSYQWELPEK